MWVRSLALAALWLMWMPFLHAQLSWAGWFLQNNDSGHTAIERQAMARYPNGDLVLASAIGPSAQYDRTRFIRCTAGGAPLAQWDLVDTTALQIRKIIVLADGSLACFGKRPSNGTRGVYLHLTENGVVLNAVLYQLASLTLEFFDAVEMDAGSFLAVGGTFSGSTAHFARIAHDGTLLSNGCLQPGLEVSRLNGLVKRAGGGYLATSGTNGVDSGYMKVVALDAALNVEWVRSFADTSDICSYTQVLELSDGTIRVVSRYQTLPGWTVRGTSMIALDAGGDLLWARKRVPAAPHDQLNNMATRVALLNDSLIVVFGGETGSDLAYVHVLDIEANEVALGFLGPETLWGHLFDALPADGGYVDLLTVGPGPFPIPSGRALLGLVHCDPMVDLCSTDHESTALQNWTPFINTNWTPGTATLTTSDFSGALTVQPATAQVSAICNAMGTDPVDAAPLIRAFPIPSTGLFTLTGARLDQVRVIDALGRVVQEQELHGTEVATLDLSDALPGMYHAQVWCAGAIGLLRLVVEP